MAKNHFSFTRARLSVLTSPQGWTYYHDAAMRGLTVGVSASGVKTFRVLKKFQGLATRVTLGLFDPAIPETRELPEGAEPLDLLGNRASLNIRMARKLATAVMARLDTGVNPADEQRKARKGMTLGEVFALYADDQRADPDKGKDIAGTVWYYERYLGALPDAPRKKHGSPRTKAPGSVNWERRPLSRITRGDVSKLRSDLAQKSGAMANHAVAVLRAVFNFAKQKDLYSGDNPAENHGTFKARSRERFLQGDECPKFFETLNADPNADFRDYVLLSIHTGARRGNVLAMRWDELSLDGARWAVGGERTKNGDPLTIRLVDGAVDVLRRRATSAAHSPWVFPGHSAHGHHGPFRMQWTRLLRNAGLSDVRVHDLRRTLGSWMASTGSSTAMTMAALGHKSIAASLIYQRLASDPVLDAMQKASTAITQAAQGTKAQVIAMPRKPRHKRRAGAGA